MLIRPSAIGRYFRQLSRFCRHDNSFFPHSPRRNNAELEARVRNLRLYQRLCRQPSAIRFRKHLIKIIACFLFAYLALNAAESHQLSYPREIRALFALLSGRASACANFKQFWIDERERARTTSENDFTDSRPARIATRMNVRLNSLAPRLRPAHSRASIKIPMDQINGFHCALSPSLLVSPSLAHGTQQR